MSGISEKKPASRLRLVTGGWLVACLLLGACTGGGVGEVTCARDGVVLEDGLRIVDVRCGSGTAAARGMSATVRYEASLAEGGEISTGAGETEPYTFRLGAGQVVPAWDEGLLGMGIGGIRRLEAPPDLAYGDAGLFPDVPPNAAVTFEVELLDLREPPE